MTTAGNGSSGARLIVLIGAATIGLGIAAGTLIAYIAQPRPVDIKQAAPRETPVPVAPVAVLPAPPAKPAVDPEAVAARASGLEALYDERYDEAIRDLVKAAAAENPPPDADDLLALARRVRRRALREQQPRQQEPEPVAARRIVRRRPRRSTPSTDKPADEPGQIIVVTRPPGLTIYLDGDPRDITPAKLTVKPGRHRVQIRLAQRELFRKTVRVAAGEVEAVDADLREKFQASALGRSTSAEKGVRRVSIANDARMDLVELINPGARPPPDNVDGEGKLDLVKLIERDNRAAAPKKKQLDADGNLDLVGLIERAPKDPEPEPTAATAPGVSEAPSGRMLYVHAPTGIDADGLRRGLSRHLRGVRVALFASESALRAQAAKSPPDGVLASPSVIASLGYPSRLRTERAASGRTFYLVSKDEPLDRSRWAKATVGIVSSRPRAAVAREVQRSLGLSKPPSIRKVSKADDLLPLLQFRMVDAVLVEPARIARLKGRTKLTLASQKIVEPTNGASLAAGFANVASRDAIERQLLGLGESARDEMGTGKWVRN